MQYKQELISHNRSGESLSALGVVLHSTDTPGATAENEYTYFNNGERQASAHTFVDWDGVIQTIPFNEVAWHAGPIANHMFIGVELCEPDGYNPNQFNAVWNNAVQLFADLFKDTLGITTITVDNLMSHAEVTDKWHESTHQDPISYFAQYGKTVDDFRSAAQAEISRRLNPQITSIKDAVNILVENGIISTPEYWENNAVKGKTVAGEYAGTLIQRTAEKIK